MEVVCDRVTFTSLLRTATGAGAAGADVHALWEEVRASGLLPDAALYDAMLQACVPSKDHAGSVRLWEEMAAHGLVRTASSFAAVALLRACHSPLQLQEAEMLLQARHLPETQDEVIARLVVRGEFAGGGDHGQVKQGLGFRITGR